MKLSFLLPTRNGGRFLHDCIQAVLAQDDGDLELVVSDNANHDETADVLDRFRDDDRMKVVRHDEPIPVTDNWNAALDASTGDYFLMLGDDDLVLPNYSARIRSLLDEYDSPEFVTYNAFSYVFPSAIQGLEASHWADPHFSFDDAFVPYQDIAGELRRQITVDMFRFRTRIPLNMQTTLVGRAATRHFPGKVFRPPFPDHYALNALALTGGRWLYVPERLLVVGVSLKSFGHFVYSNKQSDGLDYLGITSAFTGRLPGNELLNGMYMWLLLLKRDFPADTSDLEIARHQYVARQLWSWYGAWRANLLSGREVIENLRLLSGRDWANLVRIAGDREIATKMLRRARLDDDDKAQQLWYGLRPLPEVGSIAEFARWLESAGPLRRDPAA